MKTMMKVAGAFMIFCILLVGGYILMMQLQYYRIEDYLPLQTTNNPQTKLSLNETYTIMTYNLGFGAYSDDYTFFMDTGEMLDGTKTSGSHGKGLSQEAVLANIDGSLQLIQEQNCDFYFLQEVDEKATRSYGINQRSRIEETMLGYGSVFANNFHSAYLFYPFHDPHGSVEAGLLTLSRYAIDTTLRRQFPVDHSFFIKFTDLDRCFSISRLKTETAQELVLIHLHLSAYDEGGKIRSQQLALLNEVLLEEKEKNNYVIVGGDFNHDIAMSKETFLTQQKVPEWIYTLTDQDLTSGYHFVLADNAETVATCRGADVPYIKDVTYTAIVDGFIVSDNIQATAHNLDGEFRFSDHNPVVMTFILEQE